MYNYMYFQCKSLENIQRNNREPVCLWLVLFYVEKEQYNYHSDYDILFSEVIRVSGTWTKLYYLVYSFSSLCEKEEEKKARSICKVRQPQQKQQKGSVFCTCCRRDRKVLQLERSVLKSSVIGEEEKKLTSILRCIWVGSEVLMMHLGTE